MSKALASLDPSSSAGDGWCWKCLTCTLECHKNINFPQKIGPLHIHLHPPPRYYYMSSQHSNGSMLSRQFSYN
jgi:hypothetical protein